MYMPDLDQIRIGVTLSRPKIPAAANEEFSVGVNRTILPDSEFCSAVSTAFSHPSYENCPITLCLALFLSLSAPDPASLVIP